MSETKKTFVKKHWKAGTAITALGSAIPATVVPIVGVIHKDESTIDSLRKQVQADNHLLHNIMNDVRGSLTTIYKDVGELKGALNVLLQKETNDINLLKAEIHAH